MENPTTMLVSIMFVTILALAIGNILTTCAEIAGGQRQPLPERIQLSWILLMLFALLSLFWQTTVLFNIEEWQFVEFLYVIAGPMMLFFATNIITVPVKDVQSIDNHGHYFGLCRRFYVMLALHEAWIVRLDGLYSNLTLLSLINTMLLFLFLVLAVSRSLRVHVTGTILAWAGYILALLLRTLGTPDIL